MIPGSSPAGVWRHVRIGIRQPKTKRDMKKTIGMQPSPCTDKREQPATPNTGTSETCAACLKRKEEREELTYCHVQFVQPAVVSHGQFPTRLMRINTVALYCIQSPRLGRIERVWIQRPWQPCDVKQFHIEHERRPDRERASPVRTHTVVQAAGGVNSQPSWHLPCVAVSTAVPMGRR